MNMLTLRLSLIALASALVAACGGGGSSTPNTTAAVATAVSTTNAQGATGLRLTLSFPKRSTTATKTVSRSLAARKQPKYVSIQTMGMQLTITSGSATKTLYYNVDTSTPNCVLDGYTFACSYTVPTIGATETITALLVNEPPYNFDSGTELGDSFPADSAVLSRGTTTATLTPGQITNIQLSLSPIIGEFLQCGCTTTPNFAEDTTTTPTRLVVTANTPSSGILTISPYDIAFGHIDSLPQNPDGSFPGQAFVDVDGRAVPATATSTSTHVGVYAYPGAATPTPSPVYAAAASIPSSSFAADTSISIGVHYDGLTTASSTIVLNNNLTARPPVFSGPPVGNPTPASYAATLTYQISPVAISPATATIAHGGGTVTITGSNPGTNQDFVIAQCLDSGGTQRAAVTSNGAHDPATGLQTFTVTAGATAATCTFALKDTISDVVTNTATITIN